MRNSQVHIALLMIVLGWLGTPHAVMAQQDGQYSQYFFNGMVLNPAYAGSRETVQATAFYRSQWTGFEGAPVTQSASFQRPVARKRGGIGFTFTNDQVGYSGQTWLTGAYAFRIPVAGGHLALGLQGGLLNYRVNWQKVRALDQADGLIGDRLQNVILPNVGTGAYFSSQRFYLGLSVPHILNTSLLPQNQGTMPLAKLYRHYFVTSGCVLGLRSDIQWKPSILVKYIPQVSTQADMNLMALLKEKYWFGLSYRRSFLVQEGPGAAIAGMMDFQLTKSLRLGYAYEYSLGQLSRFNAGTHEVGLIIEIEREVANVRSPRYF